MHFAYQHNIVQCTVSIRHGRNIGSTWGQLRPARPQLRPKLDPLGPNFGPTWRRNLAAQLGPKLDPFGIWLQNGGHSRPNPKSSNTRFRCYFPTCQVRLVRFYVSLPASFLPFLLPSSAPRWTSTASSTVSAGIIERKLRSTKVRLFTVPCCSIILFSSVGMKKMYIWIYS